MGAVETIRRERRRGEKLMRIMALADVPVQLVQSCQRGDSEAIEALLGRISPDLYRFIFSLVRDHDHTDEIVQETLIRMFRHISKLKDPERFAPWAFRIAVRPIPGE